jgi:outer membrane murein-binding lipoprotein Lpp
MKSLCLLCGVILGLSLISGCGKDKKPNYIEMSVDQLKDILDEKPVDVADPIEKPLVDKTRPRGIPICNV